jgi:dihydropyrimidinase
MGVFFAVSAKIPPRGKLAFAEGELRAEKGDGHDVEPPPFSPLHVANSTWKSYNAPEAVRREEATP